MFYPSLDVSKKTYTLLVKKASDVRIFCQGEKCFLLELSSGILTWLHYQARLLTALILFLHKIHQNQASIYRTNKFWNIHMENRSISPHGLDWEHLIWIKVSGCKIRTGFCEIGFYLCLLLTANRKTSSPYISSCF